MPLEGGTSGQKDINYETIGEKGKRICDFLNTKIEAAGQQNGSNYDQLTILNSRLLETLTGKWKIGDPSIKRIDRMRKVSHARTFDEAARGEFVDTTTYFGWSERYFCRQSMKQTPTTQEAAVDQLRVFDWWIGGSQGDPKPVIQQLKAVRDTHRQEFVDQLEASFLLAGEVRRAAMIQKMKAVGSKIDDITLEELTIALESMFLPKEALKSVITPRASIRISATLGGRAFLNLSQEGLPPYQLELTGQKTPLAALPRVIGNAVDLSRKT